MANVAQETLNTVLNTYKTIGKDYTDLMVAFLKALIDAMQKLFRGPQIPPSLQMNPGEGSEFARREDWPPKPKF